MYILNKLKLNLLNCHLIYLGNPKERMKPWTAIKDGEMKIVGLLANNSFPSCTSALPLSQETGGMSLFFSF